MINNGKFIISLDFELAWGVLGVEDMNVYHENIRAVQKVIPGLLKLFRSYHIHATFATVGFLLFKNKKELLENIPALQPHYHRSPLTQYGAYMNGIADTDKDDTLHFAPQLVEMIKADPGQEIGSHTFSHYYCLEEGQVIEMFEADLHAAQKAATKYGITLQSMVFPKNQYNEDYIKACTSYGIKVYRGNPLTGFHRLRSMKDENYTRKALRFADAYINLSGHNCYTDEFINQSYPYNIPASRFLRPFKKSLQFLDWLKLQRIKSGMLHAARNRKTYHLWWHPHNFGSHSKENFNFLEKILAYYRLLELKYGFKSYSMIELVNEFEKLKA